MANLLGADVSQFQGNINFDVVKSSCSFMIIKATEGTSFTDPKFARNQKEARRVGLGIGYYHFCRPDLGNDPVKEARFFLNTISPLNPGELLMLDYEPNNQKQEDVNWCKKWLDYISDAIQCKPLIYLNQSQVSSFNWSSIVNAGFPLWIAAYTFNPLNNSYKTGQWPKALIQQYSDKLQIFGISGAVDGNVFFGDITDFKKAGFRGSVIINPQQSMDQKYSFRQVMQFYYRILCNIDPSEDEYKHWEDMQKGGWNEIQIGVDIAKNDSRSIAHISNLANLTIKQLAQEIVNRS